MHHEELNSFISKLRKSNTPLVDFGENGRFTDDDYKQLTGWPKQVFDDLLSHCKSIKNSTNRSRRNALGMLLTFLRLNLSQNILALLFGVDQSVVSSSIDSVLTDLERSFLPRNLGFGHITREEVINNHTMQSFQKLLHHEMEEEEDDSDSERLILVFDATYLYIQKPSDPEIQRKTFSLHKHRNLVKPMLVVTSTGYIIECTLPYYTDGRNNDPAILDDMLSNTELLDFYQIGDRAVVDRGFRDVVSKCEDYGIFPHIPNLLPKTQKQFSTLQGNESRQITMVRWVIEAVNGRLKKKFKFFDGVAQYTYVETGKLGRFFRLACGIINAYSPPLCVESESHSKLVDYAISRRQTPNTLLHRLQEENLSNRKTPWEEHSNDSLIDFPRLTMEDLKILTVGIYQLKMSKIYTREHISAYDGFKLFLYKESQDLIKAKIQSRFTKRQKHSVWVSFDTGTAYEAITGYYCSRAGARTIGCCSHVVTIIWHLGYNRHHPTNHKKRSLAGKILDAVQDFAGDESEVESDENEDLNKSQ